MKINQTKVYQSKWIALMLLLVVMTTNHLNAQDRGLFGMGKSSADYDYSSSNRGLMNIEGNTESGISNYGIGEEVPMGSGLLILSLAGAGYAALRRKRSRKGTTLLLACVLLLGFTQCKKEQPVEPTQNEGVRITLTVDGGNNNGSRVDVNPTSHTDPNYATVTFEEGDVIYVGNNGAYCGYLEHNGTNFSGTVNPTSEADYLHFYFMGNKGAKSQPTSVSITDQTSKYPVISYAHSTKLYKSGTASYNARLQNYCSIVKFTTTNISQATPITITGMNNTVTVNFAANNTATSTSGEPYTFSKTGKGNITIHAESNTERWAILLPQAAVTNAYAHSGDYDYIGTCGTVPTISANNYLSSGITVVLNPSYVDLGLSSGTKWATCNVGAYAPEDYGDYYAWGATETWYSSLSPLVWKTGKEDGYTDANSPYYSNGSWTKYTTNTDNLQTEDDAAYANWGSNWRVPTEAQWLELFSECDCVAATENGVNGYKVTSKSNGNYIFLPSAGLYGGTNLSSGANPYYSTASLGYLHEILYCMYAAPNANTTYHTGRRYGMSVRPVRVH